MRIKKNRILIVFKTFLNNAILLIFSILYFLAIFPNLQISKWQFPINLCIEGFHGFSLLHAEVFDSDGLSVQKLRQEIFGNAGCVLGVELLEFCSGFGALEVSFFYVHFYF